MDRRQVSQQIVGRNVVALLDKARGCLCTLTSTYLQVTLAIRAREAVVILISYAFLEPPTSKIHNFILPHSFIISQGKSISTTALDSQHVVHSSAL